MPDLSQNNATVFLSQVRMTRLVLSDLSDLNVAAKGTASRGGG